MPNTHFHRHLPPGSRANAWLVASAAILIFAAAANAESSATVAKPLMPRKIEVQTPADGAAVVAKGGRLIADYGSYQLYAAPAGTTTGSGVVRDEFNHVRLNAVDLDTASPAAQAMRQPVGHFSGKRMHLVQFAGPVQGPWREALVQAGAAIVTYIPNNTYLVYGDEQAITQIQASATGSEVIQWEGAYLPEYRLHPAAKTTDAAGQPQTVGTTQFTVQMVADPVENAATLALAGQLMTAPLVYEDAFLNYHNFIVEMAPEDLPKLAQRNDVVSIQPYHTPRKFGERQDQIVAGNVSNGNLTGPGYLAWLGSKGFTQAQFNTSGFVVDLSDSGVDNGTKSPNHPGLHAEGTSNGVSRVVYARLEGRPNVGSTLEGCDGHGNLNAHIIEGYADQALGFPFTDTNGYHYGLGVCPFVSLGSSVVFDPSSFTTPTPSTLMSKAYQNNARISNNSWGTGPGASYDVLAQEYDALVRDAQPTNGAVSTPGNQEMVIVFAAGNFGPSTGSCGSPGIAKNIICVGGSDNVQAFGGTNMEDGCFVTDGEATNANAIASFASEGPTTDGRHKPDLVAPCTHVSGGVGQEAGYDPNLGTALACFNAVGVCGGLEVTGSNLWFYPDGQQFYTASSGTSHSTPAVSGACALLRQYFINLYTNPPSPAMTKAYLMNSARYLDGPLADDDLWSNAQGMGGLDLGVAFDGTPRGLRDELAQDLLTATGQALTFEGTVLDPTKPLRITLAWTDAPGSTTASAVLNNDLDLEVTIAGLTYKGNVFSGAFSATGGSTDHTNNVESIFLPAGLGGKFTLKVTASNINSDGVPNNSTALDQDFALVAYNAVVGNPPAISSLTPTNPMVLAGASVTFAVAATSPGLPMGYQWHAKGSLIPGATNSSYALVNVFPTNSGTYSVVVSNVIGTTTGSSTLTVVPTVPLAVALDNTNLAWVTNASTPWYGQTNVSYTNGSSGRSYFIGEAAQSTLSTTISGPSLLSFWWKVSSQTNADYLSVSVNGTTQNQISGAVNWQLLQVYLGGGQNTVAWTYAKGTNGSAGLDAGFLDLVAVAPGGTAPQITSQPASQNATYGSSVLLTVGALGTPPLRYQWSYDGQAVAGATASSYAIPAVSAATMGNYSVEISNGLGFTNSATAKVVVIPVFATGSRDFQQTTVPGAAAGAVAIAAGDYHSLSLSAAWMPAGWGDNYNGQTTAPASLQNVVAITGGGYFSLGLTRGGTVVGWGANDVGQTNPPAAASNVVAIAAGESHALALRADGTVVAWGDNSAGQTNVPASLSGVVAVAAGGNHSLALQANGTVVAWGDNSDAYGQFAGESVVPWGLSNVVAVAAGGYHSLALLQNGAVVGWGDNSEAQAQPPALTNAVALAAGSLHSLALLGNGMVVGWGNDFAGEYDFPASLPPVLAIAAGSAHSLTLLGQTASAPTLFLPALSAGQFSAVVSTVAGQHFSLQYKNSLSDSSWTTVATTFGNGMPQLLVDSSAGPVQRFYRVQQW